MKAHLEQLMDYNYWANGLIMKYAEKLSEEDYTEKVAYSRGSLRDVLSHVMFAEWTWLDRMQEVSMPTEDLRRAFNPERYPNIQGMYEDWFDLELRMREFMAELPEAMYSQEFTYKRSDGTEFTDTYADIFTQLVLHGMQHRAECALILSEKGYSPGNLDYITYLRP
ncbi:MAG TPA: DinB family protein [Anaerolineales bacterium]|nr:DinB family protein [Anaerolineales bacterium]